MHKNSHFFELNNKIQDLFDDGIIQKPKSSSIKDTTLKLDQHHETMSSNGSNATSTSPNTYASLNTSNISNIPPSNKEPNSLYVDLSYPQGLPLKETQASLNLVAKLFNATKTKDPKHACIDTPIIPTSCSPSLSLQDPTMQTSPCP